jgi:AraC-like DNA-binding protein
VKHDHRNASSRFGLATLAANQGRRLERLCGQSRDRIAIAPGAAGIERMEAYLHGQAFAPHRHDTYAIGITLSGIQTFRFRGEQWHSLPGQCHILHPDETHDGAAGSDEGFAYPIVYIDPALVQEALDGAPLPFVARPVVEASRLGDARDIWDTDAAIDDVARTELALAVADLLRAASGTTHSSGALAIERLRRVRACIAALPAERQSMDQLERLAGLDRWTLARQFRAAFGTSRFRTMRQLDEVRWSLRQGMSLAEASIAAGFADQSHMSRRFKAAHGVTQGAWVSATLRQYDKTEREDLQ